MIKIPLISRAILKNASCSAQVTRSVFSLNSKRFSEFSRASSPNFSLEKYRTPNEIQTTYMYETDEDDKYHITDISDVKSLILLSRDPTKEFTTNDLIKILYRSSQLTESEEVARVGRKYVNSFDGLLAKVKYSLKESLFEYPMVGSLSYFLKTFSYYKDKELWLLASDYHVANRMRRSKNELKKCCLAFTELQRFVDDPHVKIHFQLLEAEFIHRGLDYDLHSQYDILSSFFEVGVIPVKLMKSWRRSILEKIEKEHDLLSIISVLELFLISDIEFGADMLEIFESKVAEVCADIDDHCDKIHGRLLASCVSIFNFGQVKHPEFEFDHALIHRMARLLENKETFFSFGDYVKVLKSIDFLANMVPDLDEKALFDKVFTISKDTIDLKDVPEYAQCLEYRLDDAEKKRIADYFDSVLAERGAECTMDNNYKALKELFELDMVGLFPKFLSSIPTRVTENLESIHFEDLCNIYYIIETQRRYLDPEDTQLAENLEIFRGCIKRCHSNTPWSPAGRVDIKSNFYKLLDVVDINEFYA